MSFAFGSRFDEAFVGHTVILPIMESGDERSDSDDTCDSQASTIPWNFAMAPVPAVVAPMQ